MYTVKGLINHLQCDIIMKNCSIGQMEKDGIISDSVQKDLSECIRQEIASINGWIAMLKAHYRVSTGQEI